MGFTEQIAGEALGLCWLVEVVNAAGTVQYRWGSGSVTHGGYPWEGRIVDMGSIERRFSDDNLPAASTFELTLDNTDAGADWLVDRATVASAVFQYRFRVYCATWDFTVRYHDYPTLTAQQLGEYVCLDFPRRGSNGQVSVQLADDTFGRIADLAVAPTLNEWSAMYPTAPASFETCPFAQYYAPIKLGNWDAPLPLAFGTNGVVPIVPNVSWGGATPPSASKYDTTPLVVCVTTASLTQTVVAFSIGLTERAQRVLHTKRLYLPQTGNVNQAPGGSPVVQTLWQPVQSLGISKGGKTWYVLFILLDRVYCNYWIRNYLGPAVTDPARAALYDEISITQETSDFLVNGFPLSAQTVNFRTQQHPVDVITDLISFYSSASASDIDTTSFNRAKSAIYNYDASGLISPVKASKSTGIGDRISPWNANLLRKTLSELCASADLELFQGRDGKYRLEVLTNGFTEQTDSLVALPEESVESVSERIPSAGERWSPYNRVFVDVGGDQDQLGPYDNATAISTWGRVLTRIIKGTWVSQAALARNASPWNTRLLEASIRPVLELAGGPEFLQFELGQYITFSWTRGYGPGGTPYDGSIFKVDGISVHPGSGRCKLTLVWQNDLRDVSKLPFLLDSESLLIKSTGSGGRTASVTDGNVHITFSTGDVVADGVVVGDFVVLEDSSLAETNFTRFRALRISAINGPKDVSTDDADLDFDAPGGTTMTEWTIRAGYLGYPNSGGNYPNGSAMYGKVASDSGTYDGAVAANKLLNG